MTMSTTPLVSEDGFLDKPRPLKNGGYLIACKRISLTLTIYIQATSLSGGSWSVIERILGEDLPHPPEFDHEDAYNTYLERIRAYTKPN